MIAMNEEEFNTISEYQVKGIANGEDVRIIGKRELVKLEPNLSVVHDSVGALYSPEECLADGFLLGRFQITFLKRSTGIPQFPRFDLRDFLFNFIILFYFPRL